MNVAFKFDINYPERKNDLVKYKRGKIINALIFCLLSLIIAISLIGNKGIINKIFGIAFFVVAGICLLAPIYIIKFSTPFKDLSGCLNFFITFEGDVTSYRISGTSKGENFTDTGSSFSFYTQKVFYVLETNKLVYYIPKSQLSIDKVNILDKLEENLKSKKNTKHK